MTGAASRRGWIRAALVVGVVYFLIGRLFALPTSHVRVWRFAAWIASACAFAAHIGYEHFRLRSAPRSNALHVAVAVAIGAFGLALGAMIHSFSSAPTIRPIWFLALVAWPALTALPAWLVAFVAGALLRRIWPSGSGTRSG
jgi:hypothetical protein